VNAIDADKSRDINIINMKAVNNTLKIEGRLNSKRQIIKKVHWPSITNKLFKLDLINKYNISFPNIIVGEDIILFLSYLLIANNAYSINKPFYNYFLHSGSLSDNDEDNFLRTKFIDLINIAIYSFKFALSNSILLRLHYVYFWLFLYFVNRIKGGK
jgi:hypothetical protein